MSKNLFTKFFVFLLVVGLLFAVAPTRQAQAADIPVACLGTDDTALLQGAITGATDGDVILVSGTCVLTANITVSKDVTLDGGGNAKIQVSGTGYRITMTTAGATLQGFDIEKTDKTGGQDIIYINASNITIANNKIHGQFVIGDGEVSRAFITSGGNTGLSITGNEFWGLRQPAYISGVITGAVTNNYTHGTKGWVLEQGDLTFTNNTWGTVALGNPNVFDIAIINTVGSTYYTNVPAMSAANNNAFIEDQRGGTKLLTPVYVDDSVPACANDCGTERAPYNTIQAGINRVIAGGTVNVAAGAYHESLGGWRDLEINKSLSLIGAGSNQTVMYLTGLQNGLGITSDAAGLVTIQGIKFDNTGTAKTGWGIRIGGTGNVFNGITLRDVVLGYSTARNLHFEASGTYNNVVIDNCDFSNSEIYGASIAGTAIGVTIKDSNFNLNGAVDPNHGYGLAFEGIASNIAVTDSHFDDNYTQGINAQRISNATFTRITANNNGDDIPAPRDVETGFNLWEYVVGSQSSNITITNSSFNGNQSRGIVIGTQGDQSISGFQITGSTIDNNGRIGLIFWITDPNKLTGVDLHHNRFGANPTDLGGNQTTWMPAFNNWWGCNEGPATCSGNWGNFATGPWLVMHVTDLAATTLPGATQAFTADLTKNNLGADTSAAGYLPVSTTVAFTPTANVDPDSATLALGKAVTTFTAPSAAGASTNVCAVLDNATVCDTTLVPAPSAVFADDSWTGVAAGADPDGAGPAVAFGYDAFLTIQEAIDAVVAGGFVNVFPGTYSETAANRTIDAGGTYQFGLFFDSDKPGITLQGVKADGTVITNAADVVAAVTTNSTSNFGPDGVYVEANNTTITGLKFLDNYNGATKSNNKAVTIVANNFTFKDNVIAVSEGGSVYFDGSAVEAYNVSENLFKFGASLDISSGAGLNGLPAGRLINGNVFTADGMNVYWASISFNGTVAAVPWFVYPVGGATITGNTFTDVAMPIRSRGIVEDDFDWASYATGNNFEKAVMAWDVFNNKPRAYDYTNDWDELMNNTILIGTSIQDEIGHAQAGDEVRVIKGTFVEDVTVDKDITLKGIPDPFAVSPAVVVDGLITITADGASVTNLKIAPGNVVGQVAAVSVYASNATVSGNLIDGMAGDGTKTIKAVHVFSGGPAVVSNVAITGNTIKNISNTVKGTDGIMIQGVLDGVAVTGNTIQAISSTGWAYGIEVTPTGSAPSTPPQNIVVTGNTIDGVTAPAGAAAAFSVDAVDASHPADASEVQLHQNIILNAPLAAVNKDPLHELDATLNYWGSSCGPVAGTAVGDIRFYPWNVDATGTKMGLDPQTQNFTTTTGITAINATIACAPSNSTFNFAAGSYAGEVIIPSGGQEHLTLKLANGVVLNGSSPCVTVNADYTTISAETIGMAACVTAAGSNGIDVADGVVNLTVDGLEIYGPGIDGIHFNGVITDVVLKDNFIHDLAGNGVFFGAQPVAQSVGAVDIHGNMFQNNALNGIEAGAFTVPAEYNSWGDVDGPAAATGGDGISTGVDADPFTHVDLYLVSSGTPWANQVVSGQTITYTVMGHLVNANAADFVLTYPANLTYVSAIASNSFGVETVTHTVGTRTLHFLGYSTTGNKTGDLPLFSVTFTAGAPVVNAPMLLDELTDGFGMGGVQSSSNIYAAALLDSTVTIVTLPTISSTNIQGYYLSGEQREFSVVLDNPSTGADYAHVYVDFTMTNAQVDQISLIEYSVDNGASWVALGTGPGTSFADVGTDIVGYFGKVTGGGFALAPNTSLTTLFRVTFVTRDAAVDLPTSYAVSMQLRDADALPASNLLDEFTDTMYVYDKPTVTYTSDPYFIIGEAGNFGVTIVNPVTGKNYANTAVFDVVLLNHAVADITAISCTDGTTTWNLIGKLTPDGANVKARIGGLTDGFLTIPAPLNVTLPCTVTYATAGTYTTSTSMVDVVSLLPERVVSANIPGTATVYAKPVITATNLGGPFDAGLPETVSLSIDNTSIPEPFEVVFSYPAGTVIVYNGVTYTCAATCPPIPVVLDAEPTVLAFTVTFDEAWTGDVSVSLFDSDWTPADRLLASASATGAVVNGDFDVTGTFSMQGRSSRAGIPVTLTWGGNFATYAPTANTIEAISNNFSKTVTYGGTYTITTLQPRYLNIYADVSFSKIITVLADYPLPALQLRAGNAVWTDGNNIVDLDDANKVGTQWGGAGSSDPLIDHGDVNFDNKVNIQDLALVGGNYLLTSAGAYGTTWVP